MTQIFPISSTTPQQQSSTTPSPPQNQFGEDTFLKLLVAQLQYQDPLAPADGTQFLTQTAQFTQLETLQKIESQLEAQTKSNQMLSAASMVGRSVTYSISQATGQASTPSPTTVVSVRGTLPIDAANDVSSTAQTKIYTKSGSQVPLSLKFSHTASGWTVQAMNGNQQLGAPIAMHFDSGNHPTNDVTIPSSTLDQISGTTGNWPPGGITLAFGGSDDPTRLALSSGPSTIAAVEQNGNDGNSATGVVTGIHMTTDGPALVIGGKNIPLTAITDVIQ